jgi:nucleotide-binding universal stress UspA family protein
MRIGMGRWEGPRLEAVGARQRASAMSDLQHLSWGAVGGTLDGRGSEEKMRVLIAVDESEQAKTVVDALTPWLVRASVEVELVSVVDMSQVRAAMRGGEPAFEPTPYTGGMRAGVVPPPPRSAETHGQALERARTERAEGLMALASSMEGVEPEVHVLAGDDTAEAITMYASEIGVDLIAVGTHGRSGLSRALMGSVAEQVVRRADRPVIVVRAGMQTLFEPPSGVG